jgi:hypothetical protein
MDKEIKNIFLIIGLNVEKIEEFEGLFIPREQLLCDLKYNEIKKLIPDLKKIYSSTSDLKKIYSSTFMTSLQKNADKCQKWPLLNLVRQILNNYKYKMVPIRKSDGYTLDGIKKYKRFFLNKKSNKKKEKNNNNEIVNDNETNNNNDDEINNVVLLEN